MTAPGSAPTDRTLRTASDLDALAFDDTGLLPVVAQDAASGAVLMVAWANLEALERTLETGELHFWSRKRKLLWRKGESSGSVLRVRTLHADCDGDTVLARVDPAGPACHTGAWTCFGEGTAAGGGPAGAPGADDAPEEVLGALWAVLESRARERPGGSYTVRLLEDENLRLKKLGEEAVELVAALAKEDRPRVAAEAADLLYHVLVALLGVGVTLDEVRAELRGRGR